MDSIPLPTVASFLLVFSLFHYGVPQPSLSSRFPEISAMTAESHPMLASAFATANTANQHMISVGKDQKPIEPIDPGRTIIGFAASMLCRRCQEMGDLACIERHCFNTGSISPEAGVGPTIVHPTGSLGNVVIGPSGLQTQPDPSQTGQSSGSTMSGVALPTVFGDVPQIEPSHQAMPSKGIGASKQKGGMSDIPLTFSDFMKMDKYKGGTKKENVPTVGSQSGIASNREFLESTFNAVALQQSLNNLMGNPPELPASEFTLQKPSARMDLPPGDRGAPSRSMDPTSMAIDMPALIDFHINSNARPAAERPAQFGDTPQDLQFNTGGGIPVGHLDMGGFQQSVNIPPVTGAGFLGGNIQTGRQGNRNFQSDLVHLPDVQVMDIASGMPRSSNTILGQQQGRAIPVQTHSAMEAPVHVISQRPRHNRPVPINSAETQFVGGNFQNLPIHSGEVLGQSQGQPFHDPHRASAPFSLNRPAIPGQIARGIHPSVSTGNSEIFIGSSETANQGFRPDLANPARPQTVFQNSGDMHQMAITGSRTHIGQPEIVPGMGNVHHVAGAAQPGLFAQDQSGMFSQDQPGMFTQAQDQSGMFSQAQDQPGMFAQDQPGMFTQVQDQPGMFEQGQQGQMFDIPTTTFPTIEVETMSPQRKAKLKEVSKMFLPKGSFRSGNSRARI